MGIVGLLLLALGIYLIVTGSLILGIVCILIALAVGGAPYYSRW